MPTTIDIGILELEKEVLLEELLDDCLSTFVLNGSKSAFDNLFADDWLDPLNIICFCAYAIIVCLLLLFLKKRV